MCQPIDVFKKEQAFFILCKDVFLVKEIFVISNRYNSFGPDCPIPDGIFNGQGFTSYA